MIRPVGILALLVVPLLSCGDQELVGGGCGGPGRLCALHITLFVTGEVRVSGNPLVGARVRLKAYQSACAGPEVLMLPSPAEGSTDSTGVYRIAMEPTQAASGGCLHVAVSDTLFTDTTGVAWHVPPAALDTVRVNLIRP